jgi:pyruvate/2-oxoglutarate dehydrogenase complex dihydrolipoamide acyltransferase (E2) component
MHPPSSSGVPRTLRPVCAAVLALGLTLAPPRAPAGPLSDDAVLLAAYYHYGFIAEAGAQAAGLADGLAEAPARAVREAAARWVAEHMDGVRGVLEDRFGDNARDRFEAFIARFSLAVRDGDTAGLDALARSLPGEGGTEDILQRFKTVTLAVEQADAAMFLGDVETWVEWVRDGLNPPSLDAWLARDDTSGDAAPPAPVQAATPAKPARPRHPLAEAEAPPVAFEGGDTEEVNALASFSAMRKARRERAMQEAQAGMQQVAQERQAAEQEYAAKKMAAAQAEAEAMKAFAQRLSLAENEALEQRKNSWSSRLKNIVSSTIGATVGAFTGGIGTQAGQAAANEIFR